MRGGKLRLLGWVAVWAICLCFSLFARAASVHKSVEDALAAAGIRPSELQAAKTLGKDGHGHHPPPHDEDVQFTNRQTDHGVRIPRHLPPHVSKPRETKTRAHEEL